MISVVILTHNEAADLPGCLQSVSWSDDVHVLDSLSTDATVDLALAAGARVTRRRFEGYASQRNAALGLELKHGWLLFLDADERVPEGLAGEMTLFVAGAGEDVGAGRMRRRDYFQGRWLKHAQISPYFIRLVRPSRVRYEREVNEVVRVEGRVHEFGGYFDHHPFSKGMAHWVEKHNRYSSMEAGIAREIGRGVGSFSLRRALFDPDFNERRRFQKDLFYRMPLRPFVKLLYLLILRRAFLDGRAGITYSVLQSIYEYLIVLKTRELELADRKAGRADGRRLR